jgi:hypothetical protein
LNHPADSRRPGLAKKNIVLTEKHCCATTRCGTPLDMRSTNMSNAGHYKHPLKHYEAQFQRSRRTILEWKNQGAPLDDQDAMKSFIALKKANQRGTPKLDGIQIPAVAREDVEKVLRGAAHALKRLEAEEAEANQQLQLAKKSGEAQLVEYATTRWLKLAQQLRAYDQAVEQARRDAGQLVELRQVIMVMDWTSLWLKLGVDRLRNTAPPTLAAISEPVELQKELDAQICKSFWNSLHDAKRLAPEHIDQELAVAMISALHSRGFARTDE